MLLYENTYSAFMLDYASGGLSAAERLAGDLHVTLSREGRNMRRMLDSLGGLLLERAGCASPPGGIDDPGPQASGGSVPPHLAPYLGEDLLARRWRKSLFGVKTLETTTPMASLLRLDPGERAPAHGHGRRDVTVVLRGSFADAYGVYETGDLAFAEPGMRHEPRAVGGEPCVCLIATEPGRPIMGFLGLFAPADRKSTETH